MSTSNTRRHELDVLREKSVKAYDKLRRALNEDMHDEDCVLRCLDPDVCFQMHSCRVCRGDGEV